ncbi:phage portal protein [Thermomonospora cellulosilytica]|uniref:Uncharacterized protein n=1 Tax=Thermomonospora cellulosilytica TaxID=1411118 RepID=A0A7W3MXK5_9ACTN|nr:phage portal protein [Thermomonospora cellulosilytica]MBA9003745.1 hypothetical protein [Thermomonospora cellulosilytica]
MPLPAGNEVWPPPALDPVTTQLAVWSAWYSSDLDAISALYGGPTAGDPARGNASAQNAARDSWRLRIGRTIARWFWGTPTPATEKRTKLHLPIARDIASTSADLLFGEPPTFTVEATETQARLDELTGSHLCATLTEAAELCAGMGGIYLRICWDKTLRDRPWISAVHADGAIPEWRWDALVGVTFWREIAVDGQKVIRHLERHEPGHILHGVYEGTATDLGKPVDLAAFPETAGLQPVIETGTPGRLTAGYVPNMRPAPCWRHEPAGANLGRADFDGAEPLMDALDETYSSLMRDIRLGKARLHVPAAYLESQGPGKGALWEDRELYVPMTALGANKLDAGLQISETQFAIRVDEHLRTAADLLQRIAQTSGYSAQTFGLQGDGGLATATEVDARKDRTTATRAKKVNYWAPELSELALTLQLVDKAVFGHGYTPERPDVDMGDGATESPRQIAETLELLHRAEAASIETKVRMLHPDWDDVRVRQEVDGIRQDSGMFDPIEAAVDDTFRRGGDPADPTQPAPTDPAVPPTE